MPGWKGFRKIVEQGAINKLAQSQSRKLASNIKKEDFLKQLENAWIPFIKKDCNVEEEIVKARDRIDKSAFKDAFKVVGITDEDLRQIITNIKDKKPEQVVNKEPKVGRNAPCPCGSGKKYKKCCGR